MYFVTAVHIILILNTFVQVPCHRGLLQDHRVQFQSRCVHGVPDHPPGSDGHLGLSSGRLHGCAFTWRLAVHHRGIPGALELPSLLWSSGWEARPDKGPPYIT